jgi:hypothetical protein
MMYRSCYSEGSEGIQERNRGHCVSNDDTELCGYKPGKKGEVV